MLGTIIRNVYVITLGIYVGTDLGYLDGSFDGYNDGKLEVLFIGYSMGYKYGKVLVSDEGIKMGPTPGKVLYNILEDVYGITLGINV